MAPLGGVRRSKECGASVPPSWRTFLRAHWGVIAGADFLTTEVWTWRSLVKYYNGFVIDLASRRVQIAGSTPSRPAVRVPVNPDRRPLISLPPLRPAACLH
jgi:hypothetical protein